MAYLGTLSTLLFTAKHGEVPLKKLSKNTRRRNSLKNLLAVLFILTFSPICLSQYSNGYTTPSGYTYRDNYWWYGNQAYSRSPYTTASYYSCGVYYPGYSGYAYTPVQVVYVQPPAPATPTIQYTENWRTEFLKLDAALADKVAFNQAIALLSAKYGTTVVGSSVTTIPYGYSGSYTNTYGATAGTLDASSFAQLLGSYSDNNVAQLYQMAAQFGAGTERLHSAAVTGFQQLVAQESQNRAQVAQILAVAELLKAVKNNPSQQTFTFRVGPAGVEKIGPPEPAAKGNGKEDQVKLWQDRWAAVAEPKCFGCHGKPDANGKPRIEG